MEAPFSDYWMEYFDCRDCAQGKVGDDNSRSLKLLENNDTVCQLRLEYKGCRTRIPLLKKTEDGYMAVYPHLTSFPKESEAFAIKINQIIAGHVGIRITENRVFYLNRDYVRQDSLDLKECFLLADTLCNRKNKMNKTIQQCMDELDFDLDGLIEAVSSELEKETPTVIQRSKNCTSGRRCPFYPECFDESKEPDNSILFLTTSQNKFRDYEKGIRYIHEIDSSQLDGFRLQYAQYIASQKGRFVDGWALFSWLHHIQTPISYLDFEWDTFAIPPYRGMKPFDVLCFQYSLHIEREDEPLQHLDFFEPNDCREAFIQSLLKNIPKTGTILVYNMEGAEKLRLQQLGEQFPEYKEALDALCARMIDLSKPFEAGLFYDNRMRGHYSLKNVLPVFTDDYSYQQLNIQDGLDAVYAYRSYEKADRKQQMEIRDNIRNYCRMDTFAEYVVYHGLKEVEKEARECLTL
ncbi:MAG: DUF2779 domain-containing protein [Erysipelotrichaceae bacterium]|nr:DUF2779 domain-containing protein [Erysipelotrichaceae bacterium]